MNALLGLSVFCGLLDVSGATCTAAYADKIRYCKTFQTDYIEGIEILIFEERDVGLINSTVFSSSNLKSVLSLTLRGSKIHTIEPGAFQQFHGLTNIELQNNSLTTVSPSWFHDPAILKNLTMAGNAIRQLRPEMLAGFSGLERLNLSSNEISAVSGESFHALPRISSLDLSHNRISSLHPSALSPLNGTLRLGGNPWNCSCAHRDLILFLQELQNASRLADANSVTCRYPPDLTGALVWNLTDVNCSSPVLPPSSPATAFHKIVLPALFVLLVLFLFFLLIFLIWKKKQDQKQVRPDRRAADGTNATDTGRAAPSGHVLVKANLLNIKGFRTNPHQAVTTLGRAKSASAILLQADFHQSSTTQREKRAEKSHSAKNQDVRGNRNFHSPNEPSKSNMELWYYNSLQSNVYHLPTVGPVMLGGAQMEVIQSNIVNVTSPSMEDISSSTTVVATRPIENDGHSLRATIDPDALEPIMYLCVSTAHEDSIKASPTKKKMRESMFKPRLLRRTFSWPNERVQCKEDSRASYEHFLKTLNISPKPGGSHLTGHKSQSERFEKWDQNDPKATFHVHTEEKGLFRGTDSKKEPSPGATYVKKTKVETRSQEGQRRNTSSTRNVYQRSSHDPRAQRSKAVTPDTGVWREDLNSQESEARSGLRRTPDDDQLLENNEYNFIDLLHEVVENHGRWTRDRWRQTHQQRIPSRPSPHL